ncbi:MAG: Hsp20/alpha crystallin family protein [bacterium]|nr:Hsp20/alpha crystallin family protein [bacterium]
MKKIIIFIIFLMLSAFIFETFPLYAAESVEDLKKEIQVLRKKIKELEKNTRENKQKDKDKTNENIWDPFQEMKLMQEEMDQMFRDSFSGTGNPNKGMFRSDIFYDDRFEIKNEKNKYVIELDVTGLNQKILDIRVNEQNITIKGERTEEQKQDTGNIHFSSKSYATFLKSIPVPADADTSKMQYERKGNKLVITLPKK